MVDQLSLQEKHVTILILIDGFLQYSDEWGNLTWGEGHNPYFNRWFSAIMTYR